MVNPPPIVTFTAKATSGAGKNIISHEALTLDLTEMEDKIASKLLSPSVRYPSTFEDVIGDGGRFANMLDTIKKAYEDFMQSILERSGN